MNIEDLQTFEVNGKKCIALVRKLTECECGRLMGCDDKDIGTIANCGVSRSAQYKMYGNSIVVDVLYHIFRTAFIYDQRGDWSDLFGASSLIRGLFTKDRPLRVATLCSGYDSQFMALDRLHRDFPDFHYEPVWYSEFDPESNKPNAEQPAVIAHEALWPGCPNLGDMTKIDWAAAKEKYGEIDLLFYSTPCFVAGTLVMTSAGLKRIEDVRVGDMVLTHNNRYRKVLKVGKKPSDNIVRVKGSGIDEIVCTPNHPFYVREMYRHGHKSIRAFRDPTWVKAGSLTKKHYLGMAVNEESLLPKWNGAVKHYGGRDCTPENTLSEKFTKESFWYLMGRYVGDGWTRCDDKHKAVVICFSDRNEESILDAAKQAGFRFTKTRERTCGRITINSCELMEFVDRYGHGAANKRIDGETISLPKHLLAAFLGGVIHSDGCYDKKTKELKITSVSRELVYGIQQVIAKVQSRPSRIYKCKRPSTCVIEGRTVNQLDTYTIQWHTDPRKQDHAFFEGGHVWFPCNGVKDTDRCEFVYNMEVDEDNSYTANGVMVHNCQSISQAGLQHGFTEGSGTRSSIIWNVRDALRILQPRFACLENVAAMVSAKFKPMFDLWRQTTVDLGYESFAKMLNAKNYGVPQNRERIFLFSVHKEKNGGEANYNFPKPFALLRKLRDLLEDETDVKYYLNPYKVQEFVGKNVVKIREYAEKGVAEGQKIEKLPAHLRKWIENFEEGKSRAGTEWDKERKTMGIDETPFEDDPEYPKYKAEMEAAKI